MQRKKIGELVIVLLALAGWQAVEAQLQSANLYVYTSARIYTPGQFGGPAPYLSIEMPVDEIFGVPYWEIGDIPVGGVADTWYDGGPGRFRIRNNGNVPAYIHIYAASDYEMLYSNEWQGWMIPTDRTPPTAPAWWLQYGSGGDIPWYALAVAVNVLDVAPRWNVLNQFLDFQFLEDLGFEADRTFGRVLGRAQAGEYIAFDLKFWAPLTITGWTPEISTDTVGRLVRFEAAEFPRWPVTTWVR